MNECQLTLRLHTASVTQILYALNVAARESRNPRNPDLPSGTDMTRADWQAIAAEIRAQL
jgi:hypothetical protein